jgi:ketosteroid isomerase-like protein
MHQQHQQLIETFYRSFSQADAESMVACYADDIDFEDPAFGPLHGNDAKNMWRMLVGRSNGQLNVVFTDVWADESKGGARWTATYPFSKTGRRVVNKIEASFEFENGKIKKHIDRFDFWKWSSQALGISGTLLGWTPFLKNKIRSNALAQLKSFSSKQQ